MRVGRSCTTDQLIAVMKPSSPSAAPLPICAATFMMSGVIGIPLSSGRRREDVGDRRPPVIASERLKPAGLLTC